MSTDQRPKRLRLVGPPPHSKSIHVKVRLEWSHKQERRSEEALSLLDSGATGAVLGASWVKKALLPCICRMQPTPILDASGNQIPGLGLHYSTTVDMYIGDHVNKMRFEVAEMQHGNAEGYLLMS